MATNKSRKSRKSLRNKKNIKRNSRSKTLKKTLRKKRNMKGGVYGSWAPWEGVRSSPFAHLSYNRFERVPFLSEMGDVNTIY